MDIEKLKNVIIKRLDKQKNRLEQIQNHYILKNPVVLYQRYIDDLTTKIEKLELLNPLGILKKGYSLTYCNKKIISSVQNVKQNDILTIKLYDGEIETKVTNIGGNHGKEN
jgi:exodeoxyribonuclease VII large subunit